MKLEKLTDEQVALIPVFRDKWIKNALQSGDELDIEAFKQGITFIYSLSNLKDPLKVYVDSPLGLQYACQILKKVGDSESDQVGDQVRDQVGDQVGDQVRDQVGDQVRDQVWDQVRDQVWDQVWAQVGDQVRDQVGDQVRDQVWDQVRDQVWDQVRDQVWDQVRDQVRDQVGDQVRDQYESFAYCGVAYDSNWMSFYDFFKEIGIVKNEKWDKYKAFLDSGVYDTILFNNFAIGCRRPKFVKRDENFRMHSDNSPAIGWRDGFELYYLDGIHFEKELWEQVMSKQMSFKDLLAINNVDQRTVALKYNPQAIIESGAELIDKSKRGNELFKIEGKEINTMLDFPKIFFLKFKCPTGRTFIEGVEPSVGEKGNADLAQAEAFGLSLIEYELLRMET